MRIFGTNSQSGPSRGCFVAFDLDVSGSEGAVLRMPSNARPSTLPYRAQSNYPLVVVGISFDQNELAQFLRCFGGKIYTYAFGGDLGNAQVDFVGFLAGGVVAQPGGTAQNQFSPSNVMQDFLNAYGGGRLSVSGKPATISMGGFYLSGLISGMRSSTISPDNNLQQFSMLLKLTEVQGVYVSGQPSAGQITATAAAANLRGTATSGGERSATANMNSNWRAAAAALSAQGRHFVAGPGGIIVAI